MIHPRGTCSVCWLRGWLVYLPRCCKLDYSRMHNFGLVATACTYVQTTDLGQVVPL